MSDSSGKSGGGLQGSVALLIFVLGIAIIFGYKDNARGFLRWAETKGSQITSPLQTLTVCDKSSRKGMYTVTDATDQLYVIADEVRRDGRKSLTDKAAYGVFKEGRAYEVRVSFYSRLVSEYPQITWIESASKNLKPEEC